MIAKKHTHDFANDRYEYDTDKKKTTKTTIRAHSKLTDKCVMQNNMRRCSVVADSDGGSVHFSGGGRLSLCRSVKVEVVK